MTGGKLMEDTRLSRLRNIGIVAHIDAGKTTTTERILYYTGITHKIGEVHDGNTVMDWMEQEQERGITITSAATRCQWRDHTINIIDTPGHVDFTVEVERCLRVLDGAIFILDAKEGVEAQTKVVWSQAQHYQVPRLIFVNKMDVIGADYQGALDAIASDLYISPLPIHLPIGAEKDFQGVISLITMKAYYNQGSLGEDLIEGPIPDKDLEAATLYRQKLIETVAEEDDQVLVLYLEGQKIPEDLLLSAIRKGCLSGRLVPVLCGSAFKNKGIQLLLNGVIDFLPSPLDLPEIKGYAIDGSLTNRKASSTQPFSALIFKIMTDPYVGRLAFLRIYSGQLEVGKTILNVNQNQRVRANKLLLMHAKERTEIDLASAGDIVAAIGFKYFGTGNTLADPNHPLLLEAIDFPQPVLTRVVEPKRPGDYEKMRAAIGHLVEEDPTLQSFTDKETGQTVLSGMGELHLEIMLDRLEREFSVSVNTGKPQVTYKESLQKPTLVDYEFIINTPSQHIYAYVKLKVTPRDRGTGHHIHASFRDRKCPPAYIEAALLGVKQSLASGILGGYEVIDLDVELVDLKYDEEHSNDVAFTTGAAYCLTKALKEGDSVLLEPYFTVTIYIPEVHIGSIMEDLQGRGGTILAMGIHQRDQKITALIPLANLFGYATDFRSLTHGNGHYTMLFDHYDLCSSTQG